jgi:hypothetical protein
VTTVFLDSNFPGGGWNSLEAGDLRISGLGVDWTVCGMGWGNGAGSKKVTNLRQSMSVLLVPEITQYGHEARATFFAPHADGSGSLSMDMTGLYNPARPAAATQPAATSRPVVSGLRALAVDYSGACGAPCLVAVADTVSGSAGRNVWQLVADKANKVTVSEGRFTIQAGDGASLCGTVVAPEGAKLGTEDVIIVHEINYHGGHKRAPFNRTVITTPGGERFFVVMTIQQGTAPVVEADGAAAGAAMVGGRRVTFDGSKIAVEAAQ